MGHRSRLELRRGLLEAATLYQPAVTRRHSSPMLKLKLKTAEYEIWNSILQQRHVKRYPRSISSPEKKTTSISTWTPQDRIERRRSLRSVGNGLQEYSSSNQYNIDMLALRHLLSNPQISDKKVRIVTWILGRHSAILNNNNCLELTAIVNHMLSRRGGTTALLIICAAENNGGDDEVESDGEIRINGLFHRQKTLLNAKRTASRAEPFRKFLLEFSRIFKKFYRVPVRADVDSNVSLRCNDHLKGSGDIPWWNQQILESEDERDSALIFETAVAAPRLFLIHIVSWIEIMSRAYLAEFDDLSTKTDNISIDEYPRSHHEIDSFYCREDEDELGTKEISPKLGSIRNQVEKILPEDICRLVFSDVLSEDKKLSGSSGKAHVMKWSERPTHRQLKLIKERFIRCNLERAQRRIDAFVHEVLHSGVMQALKHLC